MDKESGVWSKIDNPEVAAVFGAYPEVTREKLMFLRHLILETAAATDGVGKLEETLKWGEPSYLTAETKSGSTVRINCKSIEEEEVAVHFTCTTNLIETFREKYPTKFVFEGNKSIIFGADDEIPIQELRDCITLALTYHLRKKRRAV